MFLSPLLAIVLPPLIETETPRCLPPQVIFLQIIVRALLLMARANLPRLGPNMKRLFVIALPRQQEFNGRPPIIVPFLELAIKAVIRLLPLQWTIGPFRLLPVLLGEQTALPVHSLKVVFLILDLLQIKLRNILALALLLAIVLPTPFVSSPVPVSRELFPILIGRLLAPASARSFIRLLPGRLILMTIVLALGLTRRVALEEIATMTFLPGPLPQSFPLAILNGETIPLFLHKESLHLRSINFLGVPILLTWQAEYPNLLGAIRQFLLPAPKMSTALPPGQNIARLIHLLPLTLKTPQEVFVPKIGPFARVLPPMTPNKNLNGWLLNICYITGLSSLLLIPIKNGLTVPKPLGMASLLIIQRLHGSLGSRVHFPPLATSLRIGIVPLLIQAIVILLPSKLQFWKLLVANRLLPDGRNLLSLIPERSSTRHIPKFVFLIRLALARLLLLSTPTSRNVRPPIRLRIARLSAILVILRFLQVRLILHLAGLIAQFLGGATLPIHTPFRHNPEKLKALLLPTMFRVTRSLPPNRIFAPLLGRMTLLSVHRLHIVLVRESLFRGRKVRALPLTPRTRIVFPISLLAVETAIAPLVLILIPRTILSRVHPLGVPTLPIHIAPTVVLKQLSIVPFLLLAIGTLTKRRLYPSLAQTLHIVLLKGPPALVLRPKSLTSATLS